MVTGRINDLEQASRLERGLVRVRWFGVGLGVYLVSQTNTGQPPRASTTVLVLAYTIIGALAVGNVVIWMLAGRVRSLPSMHRLGLGAFSLDLAVILALAWVYSYDPKGFTWVVIYILPLEGAIRYKLQGALITVGLTLANEIGREVFLAHRFAVAGISGGAFIDKYPFLPANVAFRVGIQAIIALVGGFMAKSLALEAENAEQQALRFREAAGRESAARREVAAFNTAILTGVAAEDLDTSIQLMVGAIGPDLGFETLSILLCEGEELMVKGMYGMPFYEERIPVGSGVTGTVAQTGTPLIVADVSKFPGYIQVDPAMRSEMAAPMRIGEEVIGVVDVECSDLDAFDQGSLGLLTRLADQLALVAHSNRLLSQQRETMSRLQELDQMKSDFVAITSHELRTPITAIRGFVKTLLRNQDRLSAEQISNFMNIIDRQSARLARLVEDLLFVSRIEAGTVRLSIEEADLDRFLREAVEAVGPEARARIRVEVPQDSGTVMIDPQRVDQIVRNLVENALKFSPPDAPVTVRAAVSDGTIEIAVHDEGIGITEEHLPRIFDRFHQGGNVLTREAEGAGLGLYITKRLVDAMGGSIEVSSAAEKGSTFRVRIPSEAAPGGEGTPQAGGNGQLARLVIPGAAG